MLRRPEVLELLDQAAARGVAAVGGLDPASIDRDPVGQIDAIFGIAERRGVEVDIHLHDGGQLGAFQVELIVDRTARTGLQHKVNVSHGFALGELPESHQEDLVAACAETGVSWTTVAPLGVPPLPLRAMREQGMRVGLGTDGIRDLWSPYGDGDVLRIAQNFARLHGLHRDDDLAYPLQLATRAAAGFVGRAVHDLEVGARADLVLVDAENPYDALVRAPRRELVIAGGRVLVEQGRLAVEPTSLPEP